MITATTLYARISSYRNKTAMPIYNKPIAFQLMTSMLEVLTISTTAITKFIVN